MQVDARLPSDDIWRLVQRIERLRHRAELLEEEAMDQPAGLRVEMVKLAAECRAVAFQLESVRAAKPGIPMSSGPRP